MYHKVAKQFLFILISLALFSLMTSCRLTRTDVIGKWKGQFDDTLVINKDNSFLLIEDKLSKTNLLDCSKTHLVGQWTLFKKSIHFNFADTSQSFGGNCRTYQYWWRLGSKKKLIRPITCKSPTFDFITITKID